MPIRAVKKYTTSDGQEFSDYKLAQKHEQKQAMVRRKKKSQELRLNQLRAILCDPNISQNGGVSLALDLLNKPAIAGKLRDALNSVLNMHRNFTKNT